MIPCTPLIRSRFTAKHLLIALILASASPLAAQNFTPVTPEIVSARLAGFGGAYSSMQAGFDTLSTNPAALAAVDKEWSIARLAVNASGPLFDLASVLQADDLTDGILDLVSKNEGIHLGSSITGPLAFGLVDRNFGFGLFNRSVVNASIPSITSTTVLAGEELQLVGAYGLDVLTHKKHALAVGLQLKGFFQTFLTESGTAIAVLSTFTGSEGFKPQNIPTILATGFGVDAGLLYRFGSLLNVGIVCRNAFTPVYISSYATFTDYLDGVPAGDTRSDRLEPELDAGATIRIPLPENWITVTEFRVMADYRNILDRFKPAARNPVLEAAVGTELRLLDVVSLRAGISETYLSSGLGLDLSFFTIDFAMYGRELGREPGKRPLLNMELQISMEY